LALNKTRIEKLGRSRSVRRRRYAFHPDEIAEAEAQGLPYVLVPRVLSRREWMERYSSRLDEEGESREAADVADSIVREVKDL
jgi:hypothetical protein